MSPQRRRFAIAICVALLAGVAAGIGVGLAEDDGGGEEEAAPVGTAERANQAPGRSPTGEPPPPGEKSPGERIRTEQDPEGLAPGPSGPSPESTDERAAAAAVRSYVSALDRRRGGAVCRAFATGVLARFDFPRRRGSCPASVEASLGYRGPQGAPAWRSSEVTSAISADVDGASARVVATVYTEYADVREPTLEDDIVYLTYEDGRWLVAQPSATLYRAFGDTDVPPSVFSPPR